MLIKCFLLLVVLQLILHCYILKRNNVCRTFRDYFYSDTSENCYYDPDAILETPQIIEKYAGVVEIHHVTTEDGYILTLFRIPRSNPKGVILIHHSIATYSHIYVWQGNNSLALVLWHNGYDVWLANHRGTSYSDKHVNMTSSDYRYWDFSFHEIGLYDVSSEVKFIREKSNGMKIIFMGHSLGSAAGLVYASLKSNEAAAYLKSMILLATSCYFEHTTSAITIFKGSGLILKTFIDSLQLGCPIIMLPLLLQVSRIVVRLFPVLLFITNMLIWALCGYTPDETDPTFFNYDATIYLNNFSWKTILHFQQLLNTHHRYQMYDYGDEENLIIYGQKIPPRYPIEKISVPTLLVSSTNDTLTTIKDSETLFNELSPQAKIYGHWKFSGLNHLDYHLGRHRREIFVNKLLSFLTQI